MASQKELDRVYMEMAISMSTLSHGVRAKVGAVAVTSNGVVITGVNGLPKQLGNQLEHVRETLYGIFEYYESKTTVIHAENNILVKCAREGVSMLGSTVYVTLSCCDHCASMLIASGVKRVVYLDEYRDVNGIKTLIDSGIIVDKYALTQLGED